jgi:hypothetical protein
MKPEYNHGSIDYYPLELYSNTAKRKKTKMSGKNIRFHLSKPYGQCVELLQKHS